MTWSPAGGLGLSPFGFGLGVVGVCSQVWGGHFAKVNSWRKDPRRCGKDQKELHGAMLYGAGRPDLPSVPLKGVELVAGIGNVG